MKTCLFVLALVPLCCETAAIASTPSFFDRRDYTHGYTYGFAIADANSDGIPDLIGVASGVGVQLGNGDGTFRTGPVSDIGMQDTQSVLARDLNGDGKIDLVVSGGTEGLQLPQGVGVAFGNGDGTFQPVVFYQAGTDRFVTTAVIGDFNGDGIPDIAAQGDSGVWLFLGKSGGTFQAGVLIPVSGSGALNILAAADVNGDGKLDLLPTTTGGFAVLLGNGNGTFQQQSNIAAKYPPGGISVGDLNGDGHPDVVFGNWKTNYVWVYPGRGDGSFGTPISVYLPGTSTPAIGDVNGDGIPDLVSQDVHIAFGKGNGAFWQPIYYPVAYAGPFGPIGVAVADLRASGRLDIVTANNFGTFSVLLSQGRGAYVDGVTTQVSGTPGCGMLGDFNRDGRPDVALSNGSGVVVLFGTGKASAPFTIGPTTTTNSPFCATKGDLNNDGIADFLTPVADPPPSVGGALVSYLGNGDGTFRQGGSNQVATLGILAVGDFNGDHKLDYVLSGYLLALGNGDGTFQAPEPFVPSPPLFPFYTGMAVGDLNGDHFSDIVLSENQYGLYILLNDRAGGFQQTVLSSETVCGFFSTDALTIADVNGDGWPDIVAGCEDGSAGIVLNDGHGSFTFSRLLQNTAPSNGAVPVVGDLNGDGIPDIILLEMNSIAVFTGTGGGAFGAPFYIGASPSPGPPMLAPLHGQRAAAGVPDILVPDASGRVLTILNLTRP